MRAGQTLESYPLGLASEFVSYLGYPKQSLKQVLENRWFVWKMNLKSRRGGMRSVRQGWREYQYKGALLGPSFARTS